MAEGIQKEKSMGSRKALRGVFLAVLVALAWPSLAGAEVIFSMDRVNADYNSDLANLTLYNNLGFAGSTLQVASGGSSTSVALNTDQPEQLGLFINAFLADLTMTRGETGAWTAAGSVGFKDAALSDYVFAAQFASTSVATVTDEDQQQFLVLAGQLTGSSGSILANRGNPWLFAGNAGTVSVDGPDAYTTGSVTFQIPIDADTEGLDELLGYGFNYEGGTVAGNAVPEPATMALLAAGLGMLLRRRKA